MYKKSDSLNDIWERVIIDIYSEKNALVFNLHSMEINTCILMILNPVVGMKRVVIFLYE